MDNQNNQETNKRPPPPPYKLSSSPAEDSSWLLAYADMVTLLLVFFILLVSFAKIDPATYTKASEAIKSVINKNKSSQAKSNSPLHQLALSLDDIIIKEKLGPNIRIAANDQAIVIELKSKNFFRSASAVILPSILPRLDKLAAMLKTLDANQYLIEIHGHTDSNPIQTPEFNSNWELSSKRAINVLQYFHQQGVAEAMMSAIARAHTAPKVLTLSDDPLIRKKQHLKNRRIELWIKRRKAPILLERMQVIDKATTAKPVELPQTAAD